MESKAQGTNKVTRERSWRGRDPTSSPEGGLIALVVARGIPDPLQVSPETQHNGQ